MSDLPLPIQIIHESANWHSMPGMAAKYKHFWAFKNGKVFVAVATSASELRFMPLPMMRGATMELEFNGGALPSDEYEARQKVIDWLRNEA